MTTTEKWLVGIILFLALMLSACVGTLLYIVKESALQPPAMTVAPCPVIHSSKQEK